MFGRREFLAGAAVLGLVENAGASELSGNAADRAVALISKWLNSTGITQKATDAFAYSLFGTVQAFASGLVLVLRQAQDED